MRGYIITSGVLFAALVIVHIARLAAEGTTLLGNPVFLVTTLASAAMAVWACLALKSSKPSSNTP